MPSNQLTASVALNYLNKGELSAQELVSACLERIAEREPIVGAWQYLDADYALQQAKSCDAMRYRGKTLGPLHGIPIAIKDIFATFDMPTGWGTPIHEGEMLGLDSAVVERLRAAGAVIVGKTVLTEYAIARAGKTTNPHNPKHTPGGSSSGSAAAIADFMTPLAIGSQTVGSILRPAAYCGILGFKPSFGLISRYGAMPVSRDLDHVGVFARSIPDIALLCSILVAPDGRDPDCLGGVFSSVENYKIPKCDNPPRFALIRSSLWQQAEEEAHTVIMQSVTAFRAAGAEIVEVDLPPEFDTYLDDVDVLVCEGLVVNHGKDYDNHYEQLSPKIRELMERGRAASPLAYAKVRKSVAGKAIELDKIFAQFDVILTPVTTGSAPHGIENTGSPIFCALWTLCGLPAISIPAGKAKNELPLAIQLVGRCAGDVNLLAIADWVVRVLDNASNKKRSI